VSLIVTSGPRILGPTATPDLKSLDVGLSTRPYYENVITE
jgi:hypothetical protein